MRALFTGRDFQAVDRLAHGVADGLVGGSYRLVPFCETFPGIPKNDDPASALLSSIGMTMAEYTTACSVERSVNYENHIMLAVNMPILGRHGDGQTMPQHLEADIPKETWDSCRHLLRNVYSTERFDYVFRVGSMPTAELLGYYWMNNPIEVSRPQEALDVLRIEAAIWTSRI